MCFDSDHRKQIKKYTHIQNKDRNKVSDWSKQIDFHDFDRIGWLCPDGVIALADIVEKKPAENKIKIKCKFDGYLTRFLRRGFLIDVPSRWIKSPEKKVIAKSHLATFAKWITMLNAKYQY